MKLFPTVALIVLVAACCSMPAMGAIKYFGGTPEMTAYVAGLNEFTPGNDATISVIIQNSGTIDMKFTRYGTIQPEDLPTTAKQLTASLSAGTAPVVIKSDPRMAGDLASPGQVTVRFDAKILTNATVGEYQIPLTLNYRYLIVQDQEATDTLHTQYQDVTKTLPITIKIKPQVKITVLEAVPESINPGTEGYLNLKIKNTGVESGKKATVKIVRNGNSPIIPTDSMVFAGDFPAGGVISCRYKVSVSTDAESQSYPLNVAVTYEDAEGDLVTSAYETFGVPVGSKTGFVMTSAPASVHPGESATIDVVYKNTGTSTVYNAQARLNTVDPFTSTDNNAFLGTIKPGETATARFALSTNGQAVCDTYALDTEIRYRDVIDNSLVSDMFKTDVQVVAKPESGSASLLVPVLVVITAVLAGAGYLVYTRKKRM